MNQKEKLAALKKIPLLRDLSQKYLKELLKFSEVVEYDRDEIVFEEGEFGKEVYVILSGKVKVMTQQFHQRFKILGILQEGEVLGEMGILEGELRSATAICYEPSRLLVLKGDDFLEFVEARPELAMQLLRSLSHRLREANDEIRSYTFYDLAGRMARLILSLYEKFPGEEGETRFVDLTITQQDLAEMLGTARESVTRLVTAFRESGAIDWKGKKIYIRNIEELRSWIR